MGRSTLISPNTTHRHTSKQHPGKQARGGGRTRRTGRGLAGREQQRRLLARRRMAGSKRSKRLLGNQGWTKQQGLKVRIVQGLHRLHLPDQRDDLPQPDQDPGGNYLKQQGRIIAANKTGEKKNGKKGIFAATAQRIIRSGGGNSTALSCQGSTTSNGAKNLTALAALLNGCEAKVKTACSTENMPLPNITEVSACVDAKMTFKGMVDKCQMMKDNGTEACDCWSNDNFTALVTTIRGCKLSDDQKAVTAQLKNRKTEFSACKQAEDDGMKAMSSCATSKADLLASAKTLTENSAGIDAAKTKVDSLANSTSSSRAAAATCAEVITIVTEITTAVAANPENSTITTLTTKITSISSSLVCSDDEKTSLMTSSTDLASAKESVDGSLATIKEDLEITTGSAPTDEEISAATSSPTSTSATSARRNIVARHLLNRFNLN